MQFQVDDWVYCPGLGIGRVIGLVTKSFSEAEGELYYEVSAAESTVWVQASTGSSHGLRPLTGKSELAHFRHVLRGQPATLHANFRQRQLDVRQQFRRGTLQAMCELVRDLNGRAWHKPLSETENEALRKSSNALCSEWAAADGVSVDQATTEVHALLREARHAYQA
jgi:RNA polymerase-interacting CarD/CdnL/TRCF family regulator